MLQFCRPITYKLNYMKIKLLSIAVALITLSLASCDEAKVGDVTFWLGNANKAAAAAGNENEFVTTVVTIEGVSSKITKELNATPSCGAEGCAVFKDLEVGTYNYTATNGTESWSGSITIAEGCKTVELNEMKKL